MRNVDDNLASSEARAARSRVGPAGPRGMPHVHVHRGPSLPHGLPPGIPLPMGQIGIGTMGVGQSSPTVRLNVAKEMLQRAKMVIDRLDNPNSRQQQQQPGTGSSSSSSTTSTTTSSTSTTVTTASTTTNTSTTSTSTSQSTEQTPTPAPGGVLGRGAFQHVIGSGGAGGSTPDVRTASEAEGVTAAPIPFPAGLAQAITGIVQNAIDGTIAGAQGNIQPGQQFEMSFQVDVTESAVGRDGFPASPGATRSVPTSGGASPVAGSPTSRAAPNRAAGRPALAPEYPPLSEMADVMADYQETNRRLTAHWDRLVGVLRSDPVMSDEATTREHQLLFNQVTQVMHLLAHSQHALSDLTMNFSRPAPRVLRASPFVIPRAFEVPIRIAAPMPPMHAPTSPSLRPQSAPHSPAAAAAAAAAARGPAGQPPAAAVASLPPDLQQQIVQSVQSALGGMPPQGGTVTVEVATTTTTSGGMPAPPPPPPAFPLPNGAQVVRPIVIMAGAGPTTGAGLGTGTASQASTANAGSQTQQQQGMPNLVRPTQSGAAGTPRASTTPSLPPTTGSPAQNTSAGQATQTHPTSSTTTPRAASQVYLPQMMPPPAPMPGVRFGYGSMNSFDPFLPCQSHHIVGPQMAAARQARQNAGLQRQRSSSVPPRRTAGGDRQQQQRVGSPQEQRRFVGPLGVHGLAFGSAPAPAPIFRFVHPAAVAPPPPPPPADPVMEPTLQGLVQEINRHSTGSQDEANMMQMIHGLLGQVMGAMGGQGGGGGGGEREGSADTVADFLNSLNDYQYTEGESLLTDFLMVLARNVTFADLIPVVMGLSQQANVSQIQEPLRQFIRARILGGAEQADDQVKRLTPNNSLTRILADYLLPAGD